MTARALSLSLAIIMGGMMTMAGAVTPLAAQEPEWNPANVEECDDGAATETCRSDCMKLFKTLDQVLGDATGVTGIAGGFLAGF